MHTHILTHSHTLTILYASGVYVYLSITTTCIIILQAYMYMPSSPEGVYFTPTAVASCSATPNSSHMITASTNVIHWLCWVVLFTQWLITACSLPATSLWSASMLSTTLVTLRLFASSLHLCAGNSSLCSSYNTESRLQPTRQEYSNKRNTMNLLHVCL